MWSERLQMLLAVAVLAWMVLWMQARVRRNKGELEA